MTKSLQDIRTAILRSLMAVAMIVCGVGHSWGADYYFTTEHNGTKKYIAFSGSDAVLVSEFAESTCIWHCVNSLENGTPTTFTSANGVDNPVYFYQENTAGVKYFLCHNGQPHAQVSGATGASFGVSLVNGYAGVKLDASNYYYFGDDNWGDNVAHLTSTSASCAVPTLYSYSISIVQPTLGGSISINTSYPYTSGSSISLSSTLESGYALSSYSMTPNGGTATTFTENTFEMPENDVTVTATLTSDFTEPYYFYNEDKGVFLSRGANWGTQSVCDNIGIPYKITSKSTSKLIGYDLDGKCGLGNDLYTDNGSPCEWTFIGDDENGYTLYNSEVGYLVASNAHTITTNTADKSKASKWKLINKSQYAAIRAQKESAVIAAVETSAGISDLVEDVLNNEEYSQIDKTSSVINAALTSLDGGWENTEIRTGKITSNVNGTEIYQGCGVLSQSITDLENGIYKVTVQGFYRDGTSQNDWDYNTDGYPISLMYLEANDQEKRFPARAEEAYSVDNPNSMSLYKTAADAGKYKIELYTYVSNGTLNLSINVPSYKDQCWAIFSNVTLTYYEKTATFTTINSKSEITNMEGLYRLSSDFDASGDPVGTDERPFKGVIDGQYNVISSISNPLFNVISGATIKNVTIKTVSISVGTNAGAIANNAINSKIYNCGVLGGSVSGSDAVGGIVGSISGTKVVNCYNYATISGGAYAAGVVGMVTDAIPYNHTDDGTSIVDWSKTATSGFENFHAGVSNWNNYYKYSATALNGEAMEVWQYTMEDQNIRHAKLTNLNDGNYIVSLDFVVNTNNPEGIKFYLNGNISDFNDDEIRYSGDDGYFEAHINRTIRVEKNGYIEFGFNLASANFNWLLWDNVVVSNGITSSSGDIVANCVNYAKNITGTDTYPVYGGSDLDNKTQPLYDFFLYDGVKNFKSTNSALPAEERFLNRFEYVRATLNAERKLMAYYLWGTQPKSTENEVGKWVLDKSIAPYPIIKPQGKYPSLINPDYSSRSVGTLSVNISGHGTENLPISDQSEDEFDYGYHKVQLPYYNDYFTDNYQANKVVTGWKITSITGGTAGTFSTDGSNAYNFADRNCTRKDLFSVSKRVFAQGGFYYVPEGVTSITIEPYWATDVVYAYDPNIDKVFGMGYTESNYGPTYTPTFTVPSGAKTATSLKAAHDKLSASTNVYDHAIVLIGNLNFRSTTWGGVLNLGKAYTLMSIDEDRDNEPDYCEFYGHVDMQNIPPTRLDFVHQVGISWVKKPMGETVLSYSGIAMTSGQFEITETAFARFTEFETGYNNNYSSAAPLIFNAGLIDQFVMSRNTTTDKVNYAILGGHTYFKAYTPGCHATNAQKTKFFPVSVMDGEYEEFYLTGRNANVEVDDNNDGRVYTNGGKIGTFAGGYWEQLNGNAYIRFDHTQVNEFYGGSVNPAKPITGDIDIIINNSNVGFFCGGPKAGNMVEGKTVTTVANNTTFGTFVGAGYGGSSVARVEAKQDDDYDSYDDKKRDYFTNYFSDNSFTKNGTTYNGYLQYTKDYGILIRYAIEFMPTSGGVGSSGNPKQVKRFFDDFAQLSLARTYYVTSNLTGCTVTGNYYGGPWSGTVGTGSGTTPIVTSTLTNCTVSGSVFGGGKSAEIPSIKVYTNNLDDLSTPLYNGDYGVYYQDGETEFPVYQTGTDYTWVHQDGTPTADQTNHTLGTDVDLTNLGTIFGNTVLTIDGGSVVGSVYGAGDASKVAGNIEVTIKNNANITGNVFGGGHMASGNTGENGTTATVNVFGSTVDKSVFGGCDISGNVKNTYVNVIGTTVRKRVFGGGNGLADGFGNSYGTVSSTITSGAISTGDDVYSYADGDYADKTLPQVLGNSTVTIKGSTSPTVIGTAITNDSGTVSYEDSHAVFGGGQGAGTRVRGNVDLNIGSTTQGEVTTINGITYGGSYSGFVNSNCDNYTRSVILGYGDNTFVKGDIYGGSYGNYVRGKIDLNINKVKIGATEDSPAGIYAGNNAAAQPLCISDINYVGDNCNVTLYGGGNRAPFYGTTRVTFTTGKVGNIYGGGNNATVFGNTIVEVLGGEVCHNVFGGGNNGAVSVWENTDEHPTPNGTDYGGNTLVIVRDDCLKVDDSGNFVTDNLTGNRVANRGTTSYFNVYNDEGNLTTENDPYTEDIGLYVLKPNSNTAANIKHSTIQIDGNVFGGGNNAEVTGKTNVVIGADKQ